MPSTRALPDPNSTLHESRDFIFDSSLARCAFESAVPGFTNFLSDLLDATHRLVQSCHLPEFTDHGLPHLCSLLDRISSWELPPQSSGAKSTLPQILQPGNARKLLVATLVHDLGMLSQNPADLPSGHSTALDPSQWSSLSSWVRRTHVERLPRLLERVLLSYSSEYSSYFLPDSPNSVFAAIEIAKAHQSWPWEWTGSWAQNVADRGLAAIVAVADLLDEDSARCDTETLLQHRGGDELNRAHWIRHLLTTNRIRVIQGTIRIQMVRPPHTTQLLRPVYSALRNHFRLVMLYEKDLAAFGCAITNVHLDPSTGVPPDELTSLKEWLTLDGFNNEQAFAFQMLRTFMPEALKSKRRCSEETLLRLQSAALEDVDVSSFEHAEMLAEPRTTIEQTFAAIVS